MKKLLKKESPSLKLRLRVLPLLKFVDVDDGTFWESGSTGPQVMHCGKGGAQQSWRLKAGDIVVIKEECFEMTRLRRPQRVWHCVVTACADAWLRHLGKSSEERQRWLDRHVDTLSNAVVAAEQGETIEWLGMCKEWSWTWPEADVGYGDF